MIGIVHLPLRLIVNWPHLLPFTQLTHPSQIPSAPPALRLTTTTSGIFWLLVSRTCIVYVLTLIPPGEVKADLAGYNVKLRKNISYFVLFVEMSRESFWISYRTSGNYVLTYILRRFRKKKFQSGATQFELVTSDYIHESGKQSNICHEFAFWRSASLPLIPPWSLAGCRLQCVGVLGCIYSLTLSKWTKTGTTSSSSFYSASHHWSENEVKTEQTPVSRCHTKHW